MPGSRLTHKAHSFELLLQSKLGVFGSQEIPSHFEFQNSFLLDFPLQMG